MLTASIPAYLYTQFQDDDALQAFIVSFNAMADDYVSFFATLGLPIYTGPLISGLLLDWVAQGLYGLSRPSLSFTTSRITGMINTWAINTVPFNGLSQVSSATNITTTDDIFKRIITWHFYKGDGKVFNIKWLKRRIMRFLSGVNGTDSGTDDTSPISLSISGDVVSIRITVGPRTVGQLTGSAKVLSGAPSLYGRTVFNATNYNGDTTVLSNRVSTSAAQALQQAIQTGAVELPFQYTYTVAI